jgi:tripartite-type tricarboxylate transporter receptor subunit TctC
MSLRNRSRRLALTSIVMSAALGVCAPALHAQQTWKPDRPVTIVVPYSPGGGTDTLARFMSKELARLWGQPVNVENNPGADGLIGSRRVIDAKPDGYTFLVQLPSLTLNSHLPGFKGADPVKQLIPISVFATLSGVLVANSAVAGSTVAEVMKNCSTAAKSCSFGTTENTARLQGQRLLIDYPQLVIVNYKGGGQLITDLIGNNVNMALMGYTALIPHLKTGSLKLLMTSGKTRSPVIPNVPTAVEAGFPQLESETWYGLFAPLGTPQAIIDSVAATIREAAKSESYLASVATLGGSPGGNTPAEFAEMVRKDNERYSALVRQFPIQ